MNIRFLRLELIQKPKLNQKTIQSNLTANNPFIIILLRITYPYDMFLFLVRVFGVLHNNMNYVFRYDSLHYNIDLFKGFYEAYKKLGHGKDPLFHKKCSILKFEIVAKFCHYAEALGAFLYPCHNTVNLNLKSGDILHNLSKYRVDQIDQFYSDFNADTEYTLDNTKRNNFKQIFGYNHIISGQDADQFVDSSLVDITKVLKIIAEFYGFWKYSYNAYKHGYRLWFGYEHSKN